MSAYKYNTYCSNNTQAPTTTSTIRSTKTISKPNLALDSGEIQDLKKKGENQKSSETEEPTQDLEDKEDDNSIPSTNFENISPETVIKSHTIPNLTPISKEWEIQEILDHKWGTDTMKGKFDIFVKWKGFDTPSCKPIQVIKDYYPITLAKYAKHQGIESQPD